MEVKCMNSHKYDSQSALEYDCLRTGIAKYRERLQKVRRQGLDSITDPVDHLLKIAIEPVAVALTEWVSDARLRPGRRTTALPHIERVDPHVASLLTLKYVMDGITGKKTYTSLAQKVGTAIETEIRLEAFEATNPALYGTVQRHVENSPHGFNPRYRERVLKHAMKQYEIEWVDWSAETCIHVGSVLLDTLIHVTGLFTREMLKGLTPRQNRVYLMPSPACLAWIEKQHAVSEALTPTRMPMIEPPLPWTTETDGGFYTPKIRRPLMADRHRRSRSTHFTADQMPIVFRAVNALQDTPWKVNPRVLATAQALWDGGADLPGICERAEVPLPPKPKTDDPKTKAAYKRDSRAVWRHNVEQASLRMLAVEVLAMARKMSPYDRLWFPTFLDFRGRMYTQVQFLNPQGSDLAKGLLTFANSVEPGEEGMYWLKVHTANSFGYDKVSYAERVAWVDEHLARIQAVGADPLAERWWMEADAPFQFLAACFAMTYPEDAACLPVKMDGSCNGIQHLAAMTLDQGAGQYVNLLPGERPAGVYNAVAAACQELLKRDSDPLAAKWLEYGVDRAMAKRPTMILPYNGTARAFARYIEDEVLARTKQGKPNPFGKDLGRACRLLSRHLKNGMDGLLSGPCGVMGWTRKLASLCSKQKQAIEWTTPSGFTVHQAYSRVKHTQVRTRIGLKSVKMSIYSPTGTLDSRKQATALAPNMVHSFDAANIHLWLAECAHFPGLSANHDEIGCHAAYRSRAAASVARQFVGMYAKRDVLADFAADVTRQLGAKIKIPDQPPKGELDIQAVLKSPYFFG